MKKIALILALMVSINVSAQNNGDYYGVYDYKDSVLTLYYGKDTVKRAQYLANDKSFEPWNALRKIVIDSSMRHYHPDNCKRFFQSCSSVTEIVGLRYINPPINGDMSEMFAYCRNLKTVDLKGFSTRGVTNMAEMFKDCEMLETLDLSGFDTDSVKDMSGMFSGCKKLKSLDLSGFNTHNVRNMSQMFKQCGSLETLDLSGLNTENVTAMWQMFCECGKLKSIDLSSFNTANVTIMEEMFADCYSLQTLDLSTFVRWETDTHMSNISHMFKNCSSLKTIYNTSSWYIFAIDYDAHCFQGCTSLYGGKGSSFVQYGEYEYFAKIDKGAEHPGFFTMKGEKPYYPKAYAVLEDSVLTFYYSDHKPDKDFYVLGGYGNYGNRSKIKEVVFDKSFKQYYPKSCFSWFNGLHNLVKISGMTEYLNTDSVTDMQNMFFGCKKLLTLNLSSFNTSKVRNMSQMFEDCDNLKTIFVGNNWKTDSVNKSKYMFAGCRSLYGGQGTKYEWINGENAPKEYARIDEGNENPGFLTAIGQLPFNPPAPIESRIETENEIVKPIDHDRYYSPLIDSLAYAVLKDSVLTFYYGVNRPDDAFQIKSFKPLYNKDLPSGYSLIETYDLNVRSPQWSTRSNEIKKVVFDSTFRDFRPKSCYEWFAGCFNLTEIVGMKENLNTEDVVYMSAMFLGCAKLSKIDLSGFNTQKVRKMRSMFSACVSLEHIDISSFKTDSLRDVALMFDGCWNLKSIKFGNFNTSNVKNMGSMFAGCKSLETIDLSRFNVQNCENLSYMFAESGIKNIDLRGFQFNNDSNNRTVDINLECMFMDCKNLKMLDISHFKNVAYCKGMFFGCSNLTGLKLFEPRFENKIFRGNDLTGLFYGCSSLKELDLSVLKSEYNPSMSYMFANCFNLKTIFVDNDWHYQYATLMYTQNSDGSISESYGFNLMDTIDIFKNCYNLVGGSGTKYNPENKSNFLFAQIDFGKECQGYFTKKTSSIKSKHKSKVLIPAQSKKITYYDNVEEKYVEIHKWGFVNQNGEWIIAPKYDKVEKFDTNGVARVLVNNESSYIDQYGNTVSKPQNDNTNSSSSTSYTRFIPDYKIIQDRGKYGYTKNGDTIIKPQFDYVYEFDEYGFAKVEFMDKFGFIDTTGKYVSEPIFDNVDPHYGIETSMITVVVDNKWGFINRKTRQIAITPQFNYAKDFDFYGKAAVWLNDKIGFIDTTGKFITEPMFDRLGDNEELGLIPVLQDGKWGFVDSTGIISINPQFEDINWGFGENGLAPVKLNDKWGYINTKGEFVIKPIFDYASKFNNQITDIKIDGKFGFIYENGKFFGLYDEKLGLEERDFEHLPYARITKRNQYNSNFNKVGLVDKKGHILITPQFSKIKFFKGVILAKEENKWGIINKKGEWIVEPKFCEIGNQYDWYYE